MGKTIDLFKKIRYQGNISCKDGHGIKDRVGMDLTEEEDIKKRGQEYTEKLVKNILMTPITMMVTSLT